jgi:hypothetical protein
MDPNNDERLAALFAANEPALVDFWGRQEHGPHFERTFHLFGWPVHLTANEPALLEAAASVQPLYSRVAPLAAPPLGIHLVARRGATGAPAPPADLFDHIHYSGHGAWIALHLGPWGMAWAELASGQAHAVLAPSLAARPEAVGRFVLNTLFLNLLDGRGYSMIHATSLVRAGRLLLLIAPHNSGKSTTALRLALAGYRFIADSQIYVAPRDDALELVGFPVGETKLRPDMVAAFPYLRPFARPENVRHEEKYRLDLRQVETISVCEEALIDPPAIHLCLIQRHDRAETAIRPATRDEMRVAVIRNGAFWNEPAVWRSHLRRLDRLVERAHCYHLAVGDDPDGVVAALEPLFDD